MSKKFSVITVCYNEEKTIKKTMESVLAQSCQDYEYVIKDGGSTDGTIDIIKEYEIVFADRGIPFRFFTGPDKNIYNAMNYGAENCQGDYLIFLNSGDVFYDGTVLEKAKAKMQGKDADVFYGDAVLEDDLGRAYFRADMKLIDKRMPFVHQASMVKRESFLAFRYNDDYRISADYDFFLTLYEKGCSFENLETIICLYNANGISSTCFVEKRKEHEDILYRHGKNRWDWHMKNMFEAYVKTLLNKLPSKWTRRLKIWYKWKVKKYEKWDEGLLENSL